MGNRGNFATVNCFFKVHGFFFFESYGIGVNQKKKKQEMEDRLKDKKNEIISRQLRQRPLCFVVLLRIYAKETCHFLSFIKNPETLTIFVLTFIAQLSSESSKTVVDASTFL